MITEKEIIKQIIFWKLKLLETKTEIQIGKIIEDFDGMVNRLGALFIVANNIGVTINDKRSSDDRKSDMKEIWYLVEMILEEYDNLEDKAWITAFDYWESWFIKKFKILRNQKAKTSA